jgi:hypothetical protein
MVLAELIVPSLSHRIIMGDRIVARSAPVPRNYQIYIFDEMSPIEDNEAIGDLLAILVAKFPLVFPSKLRTSTCSNYHLP